MVQELRPGILVETHHLGSNNAILVAGDEVVLIDAPHLPSDAVAWRARAEALGEVRYLIHTDHHIDHSMGNFFLPGTIVGHRRTREGLVSSFPDPAYIDALIRRLDPAGVPLMAGHEVRLPEITFTDELGLHVGDRDLRLIALSGHTPNTIGVLLAEEGIFFSGDDVCEASLPSFQEASVSEWLASLERIRTLDFEVLVPGHGEVTDKAFVDTFLQWMRDLVGLVGDAVDRGVDREEAVATLRYTDAIHGETAHWSPGYPDEIIEQLQVRSIGTIHDQLVSGELVAR